jgi:hypothetical protein
MKYPEFAVSFGVTRNSRGITNLQISETACIQKMD